MAARNLKTIKSQITGAFIENAHIIVAYGLDENKTFEQQFSIVSFENILFDIIAFVIYVLELLFVQHKKEVTEQLYNQKSGRLPWYRTMALKFQYGFDLLVDSDEFDNTDKTAEEIEASKIIKYAAVNEAENEGLIIVKIAGETDGKLAPIANEAQESVEDYFDEIKYAGSRVRVINYLPDQLNLTIQIQRNVLVLDENGSSKTSGSKPVEEALQEFMKELPFDGELRLQDLVDKLQLAEGVEIATVLQASSSWIDAETDNYGVATVINVKRIPESGYFEIPNFDNITYVE